MAAESTEIEIIVHCVGFSLLHVSQSDLRGKNTFSCSVNTAEQYKMYERGSDEERVKTEGGEGGGGQGRAG